MCISSSTESGLWWRGNRWLPFRRHSYDWQADSSDTVATVYLGLAMPHTAFSPQCASHHAQYAGTTFRDENNMLR